MLAEKKSFEGCIMLFGFCYSDEHWVVGLADGAG